MVVAVAGDRLQGMLPPPGVGMKLEHPRLCGRVMPSRLVTGSSGSLKGCRGAIGMG